MEPYFSIQTMPMSKTYSGKYRYEFVGQGSRALAFRRSFAETLVNTRIDNWYDLHIMSHLSWMNEKAWYNGSWIQNLACLVDPPIFSHEPSFSDRFRDSGRLKALASTTAEEHSTTQWVSDSGVPKFFWKNGDLVWFRFWNHMPERLSDLDEVTCFVLRSPKLNSIICGCLLVDFLIVQTSDCISQLSM